MIVAPNAGRFFGCTVVEVPVVSSVRVSEDSTRPSQTAMTACRRPAPSMARAAPRLCEEPQPARLNTATVPATRAFAIFGGPALRGAFAGLGVDTRTG